MSLAAAQRDFLARLLATRPAEGGGLEPYRRTLLANRRGALRCAYPVVARLVGEAFFGELADRYGDAHPSRCGDLHRYGSELAAYVEVYPPARALAYLADVARLEWAVFRCGFAADPEPFDLAALAAVPASRRGEVRFQAQHGLALLPSQHPIASIWEANQPASDGNLASAWEAECAVVFRAGLDVVVRKAGSEARMLQRLVEGDTLGSSCRDEADAAALPAWVQAGIFRGIEPG
jgi:hypothetical protein